MRDNSTLDKSTVPGGSNSNPQYKFVTRSQIGSQDTIDYFFLSTNPNNRSNIIQQHHLTPNELYKEFGEYFRLIELSSENPYIHNNYYHNFVTLPTKIEDGLTTGLSIHSGSHAPFTSFVKVRIEEIINLGDQLDSTYLDGVKKQLRYQKEIDEYKSNNESSSDEDAKKYVDKKIIDEVLDLKSDFMAKVHKGLNYFLKMALQENGIRDSGLNEYSPLLFTNADDPRLAGRDIKTYYDSINDKWSIDEISGGFKFTYDKENLVDISWSEYSASQPFLAGIEGKFLSYDKSYYWHEDQDEYPAGYQPPPKNLIVDSPDADYQLIFYSELMARRALIHNQNINWDDFHSGVASSAFRDSESSFYQGLEFLVKNGIKKIPVTWDKLIHAFSSDMIKEKSGDTSKIKSNIKELLKNSEGVIKEYDYYLGEEIESALNDFDEEYKENIKLSIIHSKASWRAESSNNSNVTFDEWLTKRESYSSSTLSYGMQNSSLSSSLILGAFSYIGPYSWTSVSALGGGDSDDEVISYLENYITANNKSNSNRAIVEHEKILEAVKKLKEGKAFLEKLEEDVERLIRYDNDFDDDYESIIEDGSGIVFGKEAKTVLYYAGLQTEVTASDSNKNAWLLGTDAAVLKGNDHDNVIIHTGYGEVFGGGGDDIIFAYNNTEIEEGEKIGEYAIKGYESDDVRLSSESDMNLVINGGEGDDRLFIDSEENEVTIIGGKGSDWIYSLSPKTIVYGDRFDGLNSDNESSGGSSKSNDNNYDLDDEENSDNFWFAPQQFIKDPGKNDKIQFFGVPLVGGTNDLSFVNTKNIVPVGFLANVAIAPGWISFWSAFNNPYIFFDFFSPFINYAFGNDGSTLFVTNSALTLVGRESQTMIIENYSKPVGSFFGDNFLDDGGLVTDYVNDLGLLFKLSNPFFYVLSSFLLNAHSQSRIRRAIMEDYIEAKGAASLLFVKNAGWEDEKDPLVIDLDGDGIETIDIKDSDVYFDIDRDLFSEKMGWLSGDDGFLVLDKNKNHKIDTIDELFGDVNTTGFSQLSIYDDNSDGIINVKDEIYRELEVWRDINSDGIASESELFNLEELGIVSISLEPELLNVTTPQGTHLTSRSEIVWDDGSNALAAFDALFEINDTDTEFLGESGVASWIEPNLIESKGFGTITDLSIAISNDFELAELVYTNSLFMRSPNMDELVALTGEALGKWGYSQNLTRELTPILLSQDGRELLDRAIYVEDSEGGYWSLNSGNPVTNSEGHEIPRPTIQQIMSLDSGWQLEQSWSPSSRSTALEHRIETPYLTSIIDGRVVVEDYAFINAQGDWALASGRDVFDSNGIVIVSPTIDDILAIPTFDSQHWRTESISYNPYAKIEVSEIGIYLVDGIAIDYTVKVSDGNGEFFVWARNLDRALELQFHEGDISNFNLRNFEIDFSRIDEVNSTENSTYRVEIFTPAQFNFTTSIIGIDFQPEMLTASIENSILSYSINDLDLELESESVEYESDISIMLALLDNMFETYKGVSKAFAIRLAVQGGLKEFFSGIDYIPDEDVFRPATDKLFTPMFETILEKSPMHYPVGSPEYENDVLNYLRDWNEILIEIYPDFQNTSNSLVIDQVTILQMLIPAYEKTTLNLNLNKIAFEFGVDPGKIISISEDDIVVNGTSKSDFFYVTGSNKILKGGGGKDFYFIGEDFGNSVIEDIDYGSSDEIRFTHIASTQVTAERDGQDLIINVNDSQDKITIRNHFLGELNPASFSRVQNTEISGIVFSDGVGWDKFKIASEVSHPKDTDDVIVGSGDMDVLQGGKGNDVLRGGAGGDIYIFQAGDGHDVFAENNARGTNPFKAGLDYLQFVDIDKSQIHLSRVGESKDLNISILDYEGQFTNDSIVIEKQFDGARLNLDEFVKSYSKASGIDGFSGFDFDFVSSTAIERFLFEDGNYLDFLQIAKLVVDNASTDQSDAIYGFDIDDSLSSGKGNDLLVGRAGADVYIYRDGDDLDEVKDGDLSIKLFGGGKGDQLRFSDHTWADIEFLRESNSDDLTLSVAGSDALQGVVLPDFTEYQAFQGHINLIESIRFSDGTEWGYIKLLQHYVNLSQTVSDDHVVGFDFSQTLKGGEGNDQLEGLGGNDTYVFEFGDGQDVVFDTSGSADRAIFQDFSFDADIVVSRTALDLIFTVETTGQSVTLKNQYVRSDKQGFAIEAFEFSDVTFNFKQLNPNVIDRVGTSGSEILEGSDFGERIDGKGGDDTLIGASGGDTYVFDVGYGNDVIVDTQARTWWNGRDGRERESDDRVLFGGLITRDIVSFSKNGDDLVITLSGYDDSLRIRNQFRDTVDGIEHFYFDDGSSLSIANVEELLQIAGGNRGDNTITGIIDAPNVLDGRQGDDTLVGGADSDIYAFGIGYDFDEVIESNSSFNGSVDRIVFGKGIFFDSLIIRRNNDDLLIDLGDGENVLTIRDGLSSRQVELFEFSDGTFATLEDIRLSMLSGSEGNDNIVGFDDRDDEISGGAGSDSLRGGLGNDSYLYGYGSGHDSVLDSGGIDQVIFSPGIRRQDVSFSIVNDNLLITLKESNETLVVLSGAQYNGERSIESFVFDDEDILYFDEILFRIFNEENWNTTNRLDFNGEIVPFEVSPGRGNDWSIFSTDTEYAFQAGDGVDWITFKDFRDAHVISFGELSSTDVVVRYAYLYREQFSSSNLVFEFPHTGDRLTLENLGDNTVLQFSDGIEWTKRDALQRLMNNQASDGDDYITGSRFDDILEGNHGDDDISGGGGNDTYRYRRGDGHDIIKDSSGLNTLELFGFIPEEIEILQPVLDRSDIVLKFSAQEGSITLQYDIHGNGIDQIVFGDGTIWDKDYLFESVVGKGTIYNDDIVGSANDDVIVGFGGDDYLEGEGGDDQYIIRYGDGHDTIHDYSSSSHNDVVTFPDFNLSDLTLSTNGVHIYFDFAYGGSLTLNNQLSDFSWHHIEEFEFSNGISWNRDELLLELRSQQLSRGFVIGSSEEDVYHFSLGDEGFSIYDDGFYKKIDTLIFSDLLASDLIFKRYGDDAVIISPDKEEVRLINAFEQNKNYQIEMFEFADGEIWGVDEFFLATQNTHKSDGFVFSSPQGSTHEHCSGDGSYVIFDYSGFPHTQYDDKLKFKDLTQSQVSISSVADHFVLKTETGEEITIFNAFDSNYYGVEEIEFSDSSILDREGILQKYYSDSKRDTGVIIGTKYHDSIDFSKSDGSIKIIDKRFSASAVNDDSINLIDIPSTEIELYRQGFSLIIDAGEDNRIEVVNYYHGPGYKIEEINFSDGITWGLEEISRKVNADSLEKGIYVGSGYYNSDVYYYELGLGAVVISDRSSPYSSYADKIVLSDVFSTDVYYSKRHNDLIVRDINNDLITILNFFTNNEYQIEELQFSDGVVVSSRDIRENYSDDSDSVLIGSWGRDEYHHTYGSGSISIEDYDRYLNHEDVLYLHGIEPVDIELFRSSNSLVLSLSGDEHIVISNYFSSDTYKIESIRFDNGDAWNHDYIFNHYVRNAQGVGHVVGTSKAETYIIDSDVTTLSITDYSGNYDVNDRLVFSESLLSDFNISRVEDNIILKSPSEEVIIESYFNGLRYRIEEFEFSNGIVASSYDIWRKYVSDSIVYGFINGTGLGEEYIISNLSSDVVIRDYNNVNNQEEYFDKIIFTDNSERDFVLSRVDNDLVFVKDDGNKIIIDSFFYRDSYAIEMVEFSDGVTWSYSEIFKKYISDSSSVGYIHGTNEDDIYSFSSGDGSLDIFEESLLNSFSVEDKLVFSDLSYHEINVIKEDNNLLFVTNSGEIVRVQDYFVNSKHVIEEILFSDGISLDYQDITNLVDVRRESSDVANTATDNDDYIEGTSSDDRIEGGLGLDTLIGGDGDDIYVFSKGDGQDIIREDGGTKDTIEIVGYSSSELMLSKVSRDTDDLLILFSDSNDSIKIINGVNSNFVVSHREQVEFIRFVDTDESIRLSDMFLDVEISSSSEFNNEIRGNRFDNTIVGGMGDDRLIGDEGNDTYLYSRGDGDDTIIDYGVLDTNDTVRFLDYLPSDIAYIFASGEDGKDAVVRFTDGTDRVTLYDAFNRDGSSISLKNLGIEKLVFVDGTEWDRSTLTEKVIQNSATEGDDSIYGYFGADNLNGGLGDDVLDGRDGGDSYIVSRYNGSDTIHDSGENTADIDKLLFIDIVSSEVSVSRLFKGSEKIVFSLVGSSETTIVNNAISSSGQGIEYFEFSDGIVWSKEKLESLLDNHAPVAEDDGFYTVTTETALVIRSEELLENDYDPDKEENSDEQGRANEQELLIVNVNGGAHGVAEINADGDIIYSSIGAFSGATRLQYTISDGQNGFATAFVNVRVKPIAFANDDIGISVNEDSEITIDAFQLLSNDADGDRMIIGEVFNAVNGTVSLTSDGKVLFTPDADFTGVSYFDYAANTPEGGRAEATVTIDVVPVNDAPIAFNDFLSSVNEGDTFSIDVADLLDNDRDIDGDSLSFENVTSSDNASVSIKDDNTIEVSLSPDFFGYGDFQYTIRDSSGLTASASVKFGVKPVNDAPVPLADEFSVQEDAPILISVEALLLNDSDPDGDSLAVSSVFGADNGTVSLRDNGTILFTPNKHFFGTAGFQYKVDDGQGGTATGSVDVKVEAVPDNPFAEDDTYFDYVELTSSENQAVDVSVSMLLANDFDVDGESIEFIEIFAGENGEVEWVNADTIRFTPDPDFFGEASFYYNVKDSTGAVDEAQVLMTFINTDDVAPFAVKDSVDVYEDTPTYIDFDHLLANDYDIDGDQLQIIDWFVLHSNVAPKGVVSMLAEGFLFTPDTNVNDTYGFNYSVSDGMGNTSNAYIALNIIPVNDEPLAVGDDLGEFDLETPAVIRIRELLDNDKDVDGDRLSFVNAEDLETGYFERYDDDFLVFYPSASSEGSVQFKYHIADPSGLKDESYSEFVLLAGQYDGQQNGTVQRDLLIGSEGRDVINAFAGSDDIYGEAGDDLINAGDDADYIDGGAGYDVLTFVGSNTGVRIDLTLGVGQGGWAQGDRYYNIESVEGSHYADQLYGDVASNTLRGNSGNDLLSGGLGADWLYGDAGQDTLRGGLGSDYLDGGSGDDIVDYSDAELALNLDLSSGSSIDFGAAEGDRLVNIEGVLGTAFDDVIGGDTQNNHLSGGRGNDVINGGEGNDTLSGGRGADVLVGGLGTDIADYSLSFEHIVIDLATNTLTGGDAEGDSLVGIEIIQGSYHDDVIIGDEADNILRGGQGADQLRGGEGFDTADYSGSLSGVNVDLRSGLGVNGNAQGDVLTGIESVMGSAFNDVLIGSDEQDVLEGGYGNDVLSGGLGGDIYRFSNFVGLDRIDEGDDLNSVDILLFDSTLLPKDISLLQQGNDLVIEIEKSSDVVLHAITVTDHFISSSTGIENINFASGMSWDRADIQGMLRDGSFSANDDIYLLGSEDEMATFTLEWLVANDQLADGETVALVDAVAVSGGDVNIINGVIEFIGTENYFGDAYFSYTIQDQFGRESSAQVEVNLAPVNDAPVAYNDGLFTGVEDEVLVISFEELLKNDKDIDGDSLTITDVYLSGPSTSLLTGVSIEGTSVHFRPSFDHYGYAEFTYEVSDSSGGVDTAKVELFFESVNDAPKSLQSNVAFRKAKLDKTNVYLASDFLKSVRDPEGDSFYFDGLTGFADNGVVEFIDSGLPIDIDGVIYEEPVVTFIANSLANASFQYLVTDEHGATNTITVNVDVKPLNSNPNATNDDFEVVEDEVLLIDVSTLLENDLDKDGDPLLLSSVTDFADNGRVEILDSGIIQFTPTSSFNGDSGFSYIVSDGRGGLDTAYVNVFVKPQNDAPTLVNDLVIREEDVQTPITILAGEIFGNDSDRQGDVIFLNDVVLLGEVVGLDRDGSSATFNLNSLDNAFGYSVDAALASGAPLPEWVQFDVDAGAFSIHSELANSSESSMVHLHVELKNRGLESAFEMRDNVYTIALELSPSDDATLINTFVAEHLSLLEETVSDIQLPADEVFLSSFIRPVDGIVATLSNGDSLPEWLSFDATTLAFEGVPPNHVVGTLPVRLNIPSSNTQPSYSLFAHVAIDDVGIEEVSDVSIEWDGESISVDVPEHYHGDIVIAYKAEDEKGSVSVQDALIVLNIQPRRDLPEAETDFLRAKENTPLAISVMSLLENDVDLDGDQIRVLEISLPLVERVSVKPDIEISLNNTVLAKLTDGSDLPAWMNVNSQTGEIAGYPPSELESNVFSITWIIDDGVVTSEHTEEVEINAGSSSQATGANGNLEIMLGELSLLPDLDSHSGSVVTATLESGEALPSWITVDSVSGKLSGHVPLNYYLHDSVVWQIGDGETSTRHTEVVNINGNEGAFATFTPPSDINGYFSIDYILTDDVDGQVDGKVVVDVLPQQVVPIAVNDMFVGQEDQPIDILVSELLENDEDYDGDVIVMTSASQPEHGVVSLTDGIVTYTPNVNHYGADSFTYTITDNLHGEATATVYIDLKEVNLAPEAQRDSFIGIEDEPLLIDIAGLLANDTDQNPEDTLNVISIYQDDNNGEAFLLADQGKIQLVPNHNVTGIVEFRYTLSDGRLKDFGYIDVEFIAQNDAPAVQDDHFTISQNTVLQITSDDLLLNDSDVENDDIDLVSVFDGDNGTVSLNNGVIEFIPNNQYFGNSGFSYQVSDEHGKASVGYVSVDVLPSETTIVLNAPLSDRFVVEERAFNVQLQRDLIVGIQGSTLTFELSRVDGESMPDWLLFDAQELTLTGTPPVDFSGDYLFRLQVTDGSSTIADDFMFSVISTNDAPILTAPLIDVFENADGTSISAGSSFSFNVEIDKFSDVDGDSLSYSIQQASGAPLPSWMVFDGQTLSGYSPANVSESIDLELMATDGVEIVSDVFSVNFLPQNAIWGTSGDDVLSGSADADIIYGLEGEDTLHGRRGNDYLDGGAGNDKLYGSSGSNILLGGSGNDVLIASSASFDNYLDGQGGEDLATGSSNTDIIAFDREDFQGKTKTLANGREINETVYNASSGFDILSVKGSWHADFTGSSYQSKLGVKGNVIAGVEAVIGDQYSQAITINAHAINAQSDDTEKGDWQGFVAILGGGEDSLNLEGTGWNYDPDAVSNAEITPEMAEKLGISIEQSEYLGAYNFRYLNSNTYITIWTDAEQVSYKGDQIETNGASSIETQNPSQQRTVSSDAHNASNSYISTPTLIDYSKRENFEFLDSSLVSNSNDENQQESNYRYLDDQSNGDVEAISTAVPYDADEHEGSLVGLTDEDFLSETQLASLDNDTFTFS
ncbi:tandem-95 repeat protein [Enterovibrio norvegicus]|uniref:tandem-95 repeat protein n=1 Tax=Enterovibrio norvegicus TaxID=188144 RepID=UPI00354E181A